VIKDTLSPCLFCFVFSRSSVEQNAKTLIECVRNSSSNCLSSSCLFLVVSFECILVFVYIILLCSISSCLSQNRCRSMSKCLSSKNHCYSLSLSLSLSLVVLLVLLMIVVMVFVCLFVCLFVYFSSFFFFYSLLLSFSLHLFVIDKNIRLLIFS
jgi:hypothetical protein